MILPKLEVDADSPESAVAILRQAYSRAAPDRSLSIRYLSDPQRIEGFRKRTIPEPDPRPPFPDGGVKFSLSNIPFTAALNYVANMSGCSYAIHANEVIIFPESGTFAPLITREFKVTRPIFQLPNDTQHPLPERIEVEKQLAELGMRFYEGSYAHYYPAQRRLVIHNTRHAIGLLFRQVLDEDIESE